MKQGAILSGAEIINYKHSDLADLERILTQNRDRVRRCLLVTDSVFSMDGDLCPLPELLHLAAQFDTMLMVDEAHATGVFGASGRGCVEHFQCGDRPLIQMGTLSKALGSLGGYVAGSKALIEYLKNRAPSWIYTTGLSPADTAAAIAAISIVRNEPQRRDRLWKNTQYLQQRLQEIRPDGLQLLTSQSPIVCVGVKDAATVLNAGKQLREFGIFAAAVRPPTVPASRLRFTIMATHTTADLDLLVEALCTLALE